MTIEILMPALSPTMEEGKIAKWLVKSGDIVKVGDIIAEIETDKATMELESYHDGTIQKLMASEGVENILVNSVIALIKETDEIKDIKLTQKEDKKKKASNPNSKIAPQIKKSKPRRNSQRYFRNYCSRSFKRRNGRGNAS